MSNPSGNGAAWLRGALASFTGLNGERAPPPADSAPAPIEELRIADESGVVASSGPAGRAHADRVRASAESGLETHVEVHGTEQLEVRFNYAIGQERGAQKHIVDAYFFIPKNVGVNQANYSRERFYGDVTALMRLDAAPQALSELSNARNPASPLYRLARGLRQFAEDPRPPSSKSLAVQVKIYAHLFALGVATELKSLQSQASARDDEDVDLALGAALERIRTALWSYRKLRCAYWPYERLADQSFADVMRTADEYMSLFVDEQLARFVETLESNPENFDGSGRVARLRLVAAGLAREEAFHRRKYGYLCLAEGSSIEGEYYTYRASLLKKSIQRALYLDPREVKNDMFVRNAVGALAAALAAIWATALAMQMPAISELSSETKAFFFAAAVAAYVAKDRIKAVTNEVLVPKLRKHDHTWRLHGDSLETFGLGMLLARLTESMSFTPLASLPADIRAMRASSRTVRNSEMVAEEVIHYQKTMEARAAEDDKPLPDGYWVRDIMRLSVRPFLTRLDESLDRVEHFDVTRGRFSLVHLPKVYHVNLVIKVTRENLDGKNHVQLEHLRVVLNKAGIVRVERAASSGPYEVEADPR